MSAPAPVEEAREGEHRAEGSPASALWRVGLQRYAILIVFAALIVGFGVSLPHTFLSIGNLSNILGSQAVLWVTTEFGELAEVCDRVIVVTQGRHTATLAGEELNEEAISAAALRQTREDR